MRTKIFFFKNHTENEAGRLVPDLLCFLKKLYIRSKQGVSSLVLIYFGRPRFPHTIKSNCTTFQAVDPDIWSILIF